MARFHSVGSPKVAKSLLRRVRVHAEVEFDGYITEKAPWKLGAAEDGAVRRASILYTCAEALRIITALANPVLPGLQQYLVPPIQIAKPVSWGNDTPKVSAGLQIQALATGFQHPRSLYVLPNAIGPHVRKAWKTIWRST